MSEISKLMSKTNTSYRELGSGDAKNTDLFFDKEQRSFFGSDPFITVRLIKENITQAFLFIASMLPKKFDSSSIHENRVYSDEFVDNGLRRIHAVFGVNKYRDFTWKIRTDVPMRNGQIDERLYLNDLLSSHTYTDKDGKDVDFKFTIRDYLLGGYSTIKLVRDDISKIITLTIVNSNKPDFIEEDSSSQPIVEDYIKRKTPQMIFYGCPGTGKSFELNKITEGADVIRTTFHPNSDYATFVGAYKPVETIMPKTMTIWDDSKKKAFEYPVVTPSGEVASEKKITYKFVQQAFLKAYVEAWKKFSQCSTKSPSGASTAPSIGLSGISSTATSPYSTATPGTPDPDSFKYSVEKGMTLGNAEKVLLATIDAFHFPIIGCFGDVHDKIELVISDRRNSGRKSLSFSKKELEEKLAIIERKVRQDPNRMDELMGLKKNIEFFINDFPKDDIITIDRRDKPLLGLYVPDEKKVYLFKENILDVARNDSAKFNLYLASTYIHEMFHAFYDKANAISEIEEAVVEASTLCFLEQFSPGDASNYYSIVQKKLLKDLPEYAFGAFLYDHRSADWIQLYNESNSISSSNSLVKKYCRDVLNHRFFLSEEKEDLKNLLYTILTNPASTGSADGISKEDAQYLIIEEINRGDCAQIFGDVFQLLDRNDFGFSSYPIEPDSDIQRSLKDSFEGITIPESVDSMYESFHSGKVSDAIKEGRIMLLPNNLLIYATMNTSDQSLFPMDSAFKRRWDWRYFAIKDEKKDYKLVLDGNPYEWWSILDELNKRILDLTHSSDKQMGYWFIKLPEGSTEIPVETFVSKVVFYLWNDVFKDYEQEGGNPFTDETRFEKFFDGEGKIREDTLKVFLDHLFKDANSGESQA